MPRPVVPCQVCAHPSRLAIEQAMVNGKSLRALAREFGIGSGEHGTDTFRADHKKLERHRDRDMAEAYQAARQQTVVEAGAALVDRMDHLDAIVDESIARLRAGHAVTDEHGAVLDENGNPVRRYNEAQIMSAVREARRNVDLRARLAGALPEGDPAAVEAARLALQNPEARRAIADLEAMLASQPGQG